MAPNFETFETVGLGCAIVRACGLAIDLDDAKEMVWRFVASLFDKGVLINESRPTTHRALSVYFSQRSRQSMEKAQKAGADGLEKLREKFPYWHFDLDLHCNQRSAKNFFTYQVAESTVRFEFIDGTTQVLEWCALPLERLHELASLGGYKPSQKRASVDVQRREESSGDKEPHLYDYAFQGAANYVAELLPSWSKQSIQEAVKQLSPVERAALLMPNSRRKQKIVAGINNIERTKSIRLVVEAISDAIDDSQQ